MVSRTCTRSFMITLKLSPQELSNCPTLLTHFCSLPLCRPAANHPQERRESFSFLFNLFFWISTKGWVAFPGTLCLLSLSLVLYCPTLFHYVAAYKQHDFPLPIHLPTLAAAKIHNLPVLLFPSQMITKLSLSFKRILKNKDSERQLNI